MMTVLDRVAYYIEYHQENSVLNEREAEVLASAKSLLVCADVVNKALNNYSQLLSKESFNKNGEFGKIIQDAVERFLEVYSIPYEKLNLSNCATSKAFPIGDGSFEFVVGTHID